METTVTRTGNVLTITYPDGTTYTTKGKRAEKAQAVSIGYWTSTDPVRAERIAGWTNGIHATVEAAEKNARTNSKPIAPGGGYWTHVHVVTL
jgi:hypothetical protein